MKKLLLAFFLISCAQNSTEYIDQEKDKADIQQVLDQQVIDWNNFNVEGFMEGYWKSPELKFIGSSGITYGWQQTLDGYKERYPSQEHMGVLNFNILKIEFIATDSYLVIGEFHLERSIGNADGIFSLIFKRIDNKWVIIADHTS